MEIKKVLRNQRRKLEANHNYGILLHYDFEDKQTPWFKQYSNKIGISMNSRMYFTREEWDALHANGIKLLEEGDKVQKEIDERANK